ncbi:ABC-type sugar transport system substrate-binding protein [Bradyrhizobium japonicum]|uniref:ABC-type sugar transport system substrate-binding protein n=1 Tax=Bradyrhizobium japonicum TaxID=375 RepID=A0ABV2S1Y4_BRAJP
MLKTITLAGAAMALALSTAPSFAKELKSIGVSLGSMGNPFFVALSKGAEFEARKTNPNVKITTVGFEYDLGKQVTQIDNFIAAGVDLILLNPGDPKAIGPAIKKAQAAGIVVVAVDTAAEGADATITTNNVQAGEISCQYIVDKLGGKGDVIIENGPQVSAVIDRVVGCKNVLSKNPGIKVLSSDQDGKGSREGGLTVAQGYLTRFPKIDAIFAINDPQAIGTRSRGAPAKPQRHCHHRGRWRARHRGRAEGSCGTADPGVRFAGPVLHGAARGAGGRRHSQWPEAGLDRRAPALEARDQGQRRRVQGLDLGSFSVERRPPRERSKHEMTGGGVIHAVRRATR